jgi:hypothetical protein
VSDDQHSPTTAGPEPAAYTQPAGGAMFDGAPVSAHTLRTDRPEVTVGLAFTGGLIAALILKRLASH